MASVGWLLTMLAFGSGVLITVGTVGIALHKFMPQYFPAFAKIGSTLWKFTGLGQLGRAMWNGWNKFGDWLDERERRLWEKSWDENTEALSCQGRPIDLVADISKLHSSKKSVFLRFKDLKSKVCKPRSL